MDINPENWAQFKSAIQNLIPNHNVDNIFIAVTCEDALVFYAHYDGRLEFLTEEIEHFRNAASNVMTIGPKPIDGKYLIASIGGEFKQ
jgi:hypothetical protein